MEQTLVKETEITALMKILVESGIKGVLEYADGKKFVGTFKDDYKYEGEMTLVDGTIVEGIYPKEGKTDGKYNVTYTDGSTDVWTFKNGEFVE